MKKFSKKEKDLNSKNILKKIEEKKSLLKKFGVKKIGLFGSFVRGEQKKNSDVDFLVEFKDVDFDNYIELMVLLEKLLKRKIDLVIERNLVPELNYVKKEAEYVKL